MIYSLTDRTRIGSYRNCRRSRWLGFERPFGPSTGLSRIGESLPLAYGRALHLGLELIMKGESLELALQAALAICPAPHPEQDYLLEGQLRGWTELRYSSLREEYEFFFIEQELRWKIGEVLGVEVTQMLRVDSLLRRRSDGAIFYLEFKSAASCDDHWIEGWEINAQFLLNVKAIEEVLGHRVMGVIVEGLEKGDRGVDHGQKSETRGKEIQFSPLCYGWKRVDGEGTPILSASYKPGFTRVAWSTVGVTPAGVSEILGDSRRSLFAAVPPIRPRSSQLEAHRQQVLWQEAEVKLAADLVRGAPEQEPLLNRHFPQNPDHCRRYRRYPCPFLDICQDPGIAAEPLASGLYTPRTPNHPEE